jgi:ethanolamine ammonia-lyase small subunit
MPPEEREKQDDEPEKQQNKLTQFGGLPEIVEKVRLRTPARLLEGRCGASYRTHTQLNLREAHAAARDAVRAELNLFSALDEEFVSRWNLFEVCSRAKSKDDYLSRPDLGRFLSDASRTEVNRRCSSGNDLQIAIGDGLSVTAVARQVPRLLPLLFELAGNQGWSVGSTFAVRHCRVGILNDIGELLRPAVAVLLIGERPGLATAESLSAYMAYRPQKLHTDANRNLISNIHACGVSTEHAAKRILSLAELMVKTRSSGYQLREELGPNLAGVRRSLGQ